MVDTHFGDTCSTVSAVGDPSVRMAEGRCAATSPSADWNNVPCDRPFDITFCG